ncbi:ATP-grasp domain-containing protein [Nocardioides ferulae]|uniref:ATP-grasp domain-containing protein n=1 Tax=Nocardioides ferulae TaxID=2340821 RepID=UPI000F866E45|nr:hypothetical protein [Nocardioides ferulae]
MPTDDVLLVTFQLLPDGEPDGEMLIGSLAERGVSARWVVWDDPRVDWGAARLVAVRSVWDYHRRCGEFLAWAERVEAATRLLNGATAFTWNADKSYLLDLASRVAVVPTELLDDSSLAAGLAGALERHGTVVVKPRTGAGGVGLVVCSATNDPRLEGLTAGPWVVQPLVDTVRERGEVSVYVLDGRAVSQVDKQPGAGEVRVHELYGGRSQEVPLDPALAVVAEEAVRAAGAHLDADLSADLCYARVDLMHWQGRWSVSELELIEPGLYLDVVPGNADRFADVVATRLG